MQLFIHPICDPLQLSGLAIEATEGGHHMVARLIEEWMSGDNRFEKPGEQSYIATLDNHICGVCGLNIDPFANDFAVGRVRRLYVSKSVRRQGIGSAIMEQIFCDARERFRELRLRTFDADASAFYEAIGFTKVSGIEHCTHRLPV